MDIKKMDSEKMDINKYLGERFTSQKKFYSEKARENKAIAMRYQRTIIFLGAAIPVSIAFFALAVPLLDIQDCKTQSLMNSISVFISAALSACITITVALDKLNKPVENWYNYRSIAESLKKEEYYFHFSAGPYAHLTEEQKALSFVERIEQTVSSDINRFLQSSNQQTASNAPTDVRPPVV
ncbi:MAG: DUF4231 domain-containing protein [Cytophagales bacterium]|nr:MAG: DUF4231 domain-containing protein [Cytophagales bacterium]TAF60172.1 MAG: DUF4231 domain-containing protein [Cytophagales bacterium]